MGAKHSNWQLSQNNQYVSYALLSLGGSIVRIGNHITKLCYESVTINNVSASKYWHILNTTDQLQTKKNCSSKTDFEIQ